MNLISISLSSLDLHTHCTCFGSGHVVSSPIVEQFTATAALGSWEIHHPKLDTLERWSVAL